VASDLRIAVERHDDEACESVDLMDGGAEVSGLLIHDLHVRIGCAVRVTYQRSKEVMARLTRVRAFYEAIEGEFSRRLGTVAACEHSGAVRFRTDTGDVTLDIRDGVVRTSDDDAQPDYEMEIPQHRLI
jgi:hypothetical protein